MITFNCGNCHQDSPLGIVCQGKKFICPKCGRCEQIIDDPPTVLPTGYVMPGKRSIEILNPGRK